MALTERSVIVSLAVAGAALATGGSLLRARAGKRPPPLAQVLVMAGYAVAGASVVLFIVAGFLPR